MNLFYSSIAALVILAGFAFFIVRLNRDLLRAEAYREFFLRLVPAISTAVFLAGLPFVMGQARVEDYAIVLLVYLGGAATLTALMARAVATEERRATTAFRKGEYQKAISMYERLIEHRPLPRYFSALGACHDAAGNPHDALDATETAVKLDPKLGIAYFNRASALFALDERTRAKSDLETVFLVDSNRQLRNAATEALKAFGKD
jgi:tetratricopeptide (TPR) repeat protein